MTADASYEDLAACPCCGLIHAVPQLQPDQVAHCRRCRTTIQDGRGGGDHNAALMATIAALILYLPAVSLPIMRLEQLGHVHESSIIGGSFALFQHGEYVVGLVVFACSVVIPLGKLLTLLLLSLKPPRRAHHVATTHRWVEHLGRWGMIDVLLVAVLVAALKLGDLVSVSPGPAALLFTAMVILSLLASAWFNPRALWRAPYATYSAPTSNSRNQPFAQ